MSATKENVLAGGELGGYDDVDIFGLDAFGQVPEGHMGPLYGAMIGTGVGTLTAIGVRSFKGGADGWGQYSEAIGLAAGVIVGGAMLLYQPTRNAGWVAMASAALNNGLRAVEMYMKTDDHGKAHPLGYAQVQTARRMGPQSLGMPDVQNLGRNRRLAGPTLMGPQLLGSGPQFGKHAAHYGAHYGASSILQGRE